MGPLVDVPISIQPAYEFRTLSKSKTPLKRLQEMTTMALLDLQGMDVPGGHNCGGGGGGGGGSTLTVLGCASQTPSNISLVLCH
jgi:hypothetical protein